MWCSPAGNEFKWRYSEEVHGKHTVLLHSPWSCTSCVDATGSNPSWLLRTQAQSPAQQPKACPGEEDSPCPPPGRNQLCLCHSHPFPTCFSKSLGMHIVCCPRAIFCTASLHFQFKRFFLLSEFPMLQLVLQLRCSQPHVQQCHSTCLCRAGSQPGQPRMLLTSSAKGQRQAQIVMQFAPFSAVMFDYFCPGLIPIELSFFPDFFFSLFAKIFWYSNCGWLAAPLSLVASADLAVIVSLGGIARFEILYIAKLWNWKWTWHPNRPALPEPKGHWLNFFF